MYNMNNATILVCDAVYNTLRVTIYRTLVGPTLFAKSHLFI